MRNYRRIYEVIEDVYGHGRPWKAMEGHGRPWKVIEGHKMFMRTGKVIERLTRF